MALVNCPDCGRRLRAPDRPGPMSLRCPACKTVFQTDGPGENPMDASGSPIADATAPDAVSFSEADREDVARYGSGSGLLELTRESDDTSLGDVFYSAEKDAGATSVSPALHQADPAAAAALEMANRLAETHLAELKRTRKGLKVSWILVALLVLATGVSVWYATRQMGRREMAEQTAAGLNANLHETKSALSRMETIREGLQAELSDARQQAEMVHSERRALQNEKDRLQTDREKLAADLADVREQLAEANVEAKLRTAELDEAKARVAKLETELQEARMVLRPSNGGTTTEPANP